MAGKMGPGWLLIASAPVLPPLGFLAFVAWRQLRPGLLPVWAGLPLGLFDDLFSGQPFGTAVMLWSIAAIVLDVIEARLGGSIRDFFASHGEVAFRDLEQQVIDEETQRPSGVLATGGGAVLRGFTAMNVGERNAAFVMQFLKTERIPVLAEDLNDIYPRKVFFFPRTGKVLVKKLMQTHNDTLAKRELDYAKRLKVEPVGGAIDLF